MIPEIVESLLKRRSGSLRSLAVELGFPANFAPTLSDMLNVERHGHVSVETWSKVSVALGWVRWRIFVLTAASTTSAGVACAVGISQWWTWCVWP